VVYVHGGGWRIGDKDMATRTFFQRLAGQGHVVMDISYNLWPEAEITTMVGEVKRAVLWLKERSQAYDVNPERLVLMGGSAGAHLALLAAYTPGHTALPPTGMAGDASVRGAVAFYPPVDFFALWQLNQETFAREGSSGAQGLIERAAEGMLDWTFALPDPELGADVRFRTFLSAILGGDPGEAQETYQLLSPSSHVGPHCPPTLLLQGCDDVFHLASSVRGLHQDLQAAGVPTTLVEYPHTEHAFDLVLPQISPLAKAASQDVERFLANLA
jgi:acetyl esterase/lipase